MPNFYLSTFTQAILEKRKLEITYYLKNSRKTNTRICAPIDFSAGENPKRDKEYYWFFDFQGSNGGHITDKLPNEIKGMKLLDESFNHKDVCESERSWKIKRTNWIY